MSTVKLNRLKIHKYRNVRPGTELRFDDGVNLVLGQNGSGKTTLLGLLTCVAGSDLSPLQNEAFELEYELTGGDFTAQIRVRADAQGGMPEERETPRGMAHGATQASFDCRLLISSNRSSDTLEVHGTQDGSRLRSPGESQEEEFGPIGIFTPRALLDLLDNIEDSSPFAQASDGLYVSLAARFDESLDAFLAMTGRLPVTTSMGTPPVARLHVVRNPKASGYSRLRQFAPQQLGKLVPAAHENPGGETRVRLVADDGASPSAEISQALAFLVSAASAIGFIGAALKPEIKTIRTLGATDRQLFEVEGFTFSFTRRDGTTIHHDLLSYGQKRLLAYYYYLAATEHIVIADELVNGLHHRWIEACMTAIGERQAFLTSQNPLLFEYVRFGSIEQVQSAFITCKTEIVDGVEQLVWQNMPREDAENFYRGYQADIESVGDILINRGLW